MSPADGQGRDRPNRRDAADPALRRGRRSPQDRKERLATALRRNLSRRKASQADIGPGTDGDKGQADE